MSEEGGNHVELVRAHPSVLTSAAVLMFVLFDCWQICKFIPLNLADLFASPWLEMSVFGHSSEDEQLHMLLSHGLLNILHVFLIVDQTCSFEVESSFFVYFAYMRSPGRFRPC